MLTIYRTLMKISLAQQLQYRAAMLIWLIGFILEPTVYAVVWSTVARSSPAGIGFTPSELVLYFLAAMLLNHLTFDWHMFEMEFRVRNGSFSPPLLRPLHPIHGDLANNITYKLMTFPFMFAAVLALYFTFGVTLRTQPWAAVLFIPAVVLGFAMRFLLEWTIALAAFWTTRIQAVNTVYIILSVFLSGRFGPLDLLPGSVPAVARLLPFRLWISFPVELLLGRMTPQQAAMSFIQQGIWIVVFYALFRAVWHQGMKRYSAVGA
jgi:ABC-2 type transport system permease protein